MLQHRKKDCTGKAYLSLSVYLYLLVYDVKAPDNLEAVGDQLTRMEAILTNPEIRSQGEDSGLIVDKQSQSEHSSDQEINLKLVDMKIRPSKDDGSDSVFCVRQLEGGEPQEVKNDPVPEDVAPGRG